MKTIIEVRDSIAETMKKIGAPLSDDQSLALAGCLGVWLNQWSVIDVKPAAQSTEAIRKALEWYADESVALSRNMLAKNDQAVLASVTVLALDAGKRANDALSSQPAPCDSAQPEQKPFLIKGTGKRNGDGWKDTTEIGQVVYAWNYELPEPHAPGQYPRLGCPIWSASTEQFTFDAVESLDAQSIVEDYIESERDKLRTEIDTLRQQLEEQQLVQGVDAEIIQKIIQRRCHGFLSMDECRNMGLEIIATHAAQEKE